MIWLPISPFPGSIRSRQVFVLSFQHSDVVRTERLELSHLAALEPLPPSATPDVYAGRSNCRFGPPSRTQNSVAPATAAGMISRFSTGTSKAA